LHCFGIVSALRDSLNEDSTKDWWRETQWLEILDFRETGWAKSRLRVETKSNPESMPQPTATLTIAIFAKQNPTAAEYGDGLL
jgi:hypothetical protein